MPDSRIWRHRTGEFVLGGRTLLMGIVNVTPDSFSDGGKFFERDAAIEHALRLAHEGADILDFGAESTRPGSSPVPPDEQLRRLIPILEAVARESQIPLSVDTTCAAVAAVAIQAGVSIVNDVAALRGDREMATVCASAEVGVALMHMRGTPANMQSDTKYANLIGEIRMHLASVVDDATRAGISCDRIVVDPGIGFGKSFEQNYELIGSLREFAQLASGVLAGPSRKGFTAEFSGKPAAARQFATAAAVVLCALNGADIVRVHDVAEMKEVVQIVDRYREVNERRD